MTSANRLPPSYDDAIRHVGAYGNQSTTPPALQSIIIRPIATSSQTPASIQPAAMNERTLIQQSTNQPILYMVQQPANQPTYTVQEPTNQLTYMVRQSTTQPPLYMIQHPTSPPTHTIQQPRIVIPDHNYMQPAAIPPPTYEPQPTTTPNIIRQQEQVSPQNVIDMKKAHRLDFVAGILTIITSVILMWGLGTNHWTVSKAYEGNVHYSRNDGFWRHCRYMIGRGLVLHNCRYHIDRPFGYRAITVEGVIMAFALTFYGIGAVLMCMVAFSRIKKKRRIITATIVLYCLALVVMLGALGTFAVELRNNGLYEIKENKSKASTTLSWSFGLTLVAPCGILAIIILNGISCYKYAGLRDGQGVTSTPVGRTAGARRVAMSTPAGARSVRFPSPPGSPAIMLPSPPGSPTIMLPSPPGSPAIMLPSPAGRPGIMLHRPAGSPAMMLHSQAGSRAIMLPRPASSPGVMLPRQVEGPDITASLTTSTASTPQPSSSNTSQYVSTATTSIHDA